MLYVVILALFAATVVVADPIQFTNCGSTGQLQEVDVQGCSSLPCIFRKGQTYEIVTTFVPPTSSSSASLEVAALVSIITVPIINPQPGNGCPGLSSGCPFPAGGTLTHRFSITITEQFIETQANVIVRLRNNENGLVVCFRAPAQIVA